MERHYEVWVRRADLTVLERALFANTDTLAHWLAVRGAVYTGRGGFRLTADGEAAYPVIMTVTDADDSTTIWKWRAVKALVPAYERHLARIAKTAA